MAFSCFFMVISLIAVAQAGYSSAYAGWPGFPSVQVGRAGFPQLRMPGFPTFPQLPFRPFPPSAIRVPSVEDIERAQSQSGSFNGMASRSTSVTTRDAEGNLVRKGMTTMVVNNNGNVTKLEVPLN